MLELYGSKGSILAKGTIGQGDSGQMFAYLEDDNTGYNAQQTRDSEDKLIINPVPVNTYCAEIEEFSNAIFDNREPVNGALIGLRSQQLLTACYQSAKTRKVIDV